ncbi:hypothetical protein L1987_07954 [Smallanthus sonchifolius]|uniref:Uncharacterized protein n=1 Tax=Smallanthus sonchifolius TaxID=185202 RepID=A0ACB9JMB5_9ASTR|nr:hypothetical protein L1987_07954 [Smallanthus sonchifolius]
MVVGWPAGDVRLLQATEVCWGWVKENGVLEFGNEEKVMLFLDKIFNWNILIQDIAKITEEGLTISQPNLLKTFWKFAAFQNPTVGAEG